MVIAASVDWHYVTLRNHCQKAGRSTSAPDRAAPESYIAEFFAHRPPMAMAEAQIAIIKDLKTAGRVKVTQKAGGVTGSRTSGLNENSLGRQQEMCMKKTKNTLERYLIPQAIPLTQYLSNL
ncbi:hypothetical protein EYF80_038270 [Liparis tanakae]|uniref:Uncharacterized protein n=1 Tax=Liparis tanakae TaxID=230148 RepID=A0A4Z2GDU9_9TELE|nr:hypothetical protein EYF80_038270 [Liparis tanakae]